MKLINTKPSTDTKLCRQIVARNNLILYFYSLFLPRLIRQATWVHYAFYYTSHELTTKARNTDSIKLLGDWSQDWIDQTSGKNSHSPVIRALVEITQKYELSEDLIKDYLSSQAQDVYQLSYENFAEFDDYLDSSGGNVSKLLAKTFGYRDTEFLAGIAKLGKAIRLVQILGGLSNYQSDEVLYISQEDMDKFGVTKDDFIKKNFGTNMSLLIKHYVERGFTWFEEAVPHINYLPHSTRLSVRLLAEHYEDNLVAMEQANYNIYQAKLLPSKIDRLKKMVTIWRYNKRYDRL